MGILQNDNSIKMKALILIAALALVSCTEEELATLSNWGILAWNLPVEREDGTALSMSEIQGIHIYSGTESGDYQQDYYSEDTTLTFATIWSAGFDTTQVNYYVMTTVDTEGRESKYSPEHIR